MFSAKQSKSNFGLETGLTYLETDLTYLETGLTYLETHEAMGKSPQPKFQGNPHVFGKPRNNPYSRQALEGGPVEETPPGGHHLCTQIMMDFIIL